MDLSNTLDDLIVLSRELGSPAHDWAILGEGNTSARLDSVRFYVKASGSQMSSLTGDQLARVAFAPILAALESVAVITDSETKDLLLGSCDDQKRMPSVETLMHAYLLTQPGVQFIGHTHILSVNSLTCSKGGWDALMSGGRMFPDEIVVCGIAPCCVPYTDPGIPLARAVRDAVARFQNQHGENPKTIYMQNHGFIALGATAKQVVDITRMADKAAKIMLGAFAAGGPTFLTTENVRRIHTRPDEHFRAAAIARGA